MKVPGTLSVIAWVVFTTHCMAQANCKCRPASTQTFYKKAQTVCVKNTKHADTLKVSLFTKFFNLKMPQLPLEDYLLAAQKALLEKLL
jgi:hypothetical protein